MTRSGQKADRPRNVRSTHDPYAAAVLQTIRRRALAAAGDALLIAVSAGPDSTALLAALAELHATGAVGALSALHVDPGLRPGGAEDAAACRELCRTLGVPFASVRVEVGAGNVQAAAREARYAALRAEALRVGAARIATGHTRTDQAETVLLRLLRGAGARGLAGIPPRRGVLVRPLIDRARQEGLDYLRRRHLGWRDDPTNATPRFARNRLRQRLWPILLEMNPAAEAALARAADLLRDDERALARRAGALVGTASSVALDRLDAEPRAIRRRVVRRLAARVGRGGVASPEALHVEAVLGLLRRGGGGRTELPGGLEARVERGRLTVRRRVAVVRAEAVVPLEIRGPGRYRVEGLGLEVEVVAPPGAALPWPLQLRTRRPGDRFRPARGRGGKKLKAWLIDRKVPRPRRERLLLLADGAGAVLAIPELEATAAGLPEGFSVRLLT
jgi:tRNA(Ile)-lysidine synthase